MLGIRYVARKIGAERYLHQIERAKVLGSDAWARSRGICGEVNSLPALRAVLNNTSFFGSTVQPDLHPAGMGEGIPVAI